MYSTNQFSYNSETSTFSADASELGWPVGKFKESVDIQSEKTGRVLRFRFLTFHEGQDLVKYQAAVDNQKVVTLVVYND